MYELEIIIPAYNSHKTIIKTLDSISIQKEMPNYHVTISNDNGKDYHEIIKKYKDKLNIDEIRTPTNGGPGLARQYAVDNSNSKYIIFIDSDDIFYDENSISLLYKKINETNVDIVISNFIYQKNGIKKVEEKSTVWLHGKIYKRDFLTSNNIKFSELRTNEDNAFNGLIFMLNPVIIWLNKITYIYEDNKNSLTRNNEYKIEGLKTYVESIKWVIQESNKRDVDNKKIGTKSLEGLYYLYLRYNEESNEEILNIGKELLPEYTKYQDIIIEDINNIQKIRPVENQQLTFDEFIKKIINY